MTRQIAAILYWLTLFSSASIADDLTIPNTFQPNTPARAADVNANFSAVEASVDDNAADIAVNGSSIAGNTTAIAINAGNISNNTTAIANNAASIASMSALGGITVYSQGAVVGRFLSLNDVWFLLSDRSFVFSVNSLVPLYAGDRNIYFAEADCSGQALVENRNFGVFMASMLSLGMVFPALDSAAAPAPMYYTNRGSQPSIRTYASVVNNNACNNEQGTTSFFEAFPNDVQVTGVPNTPPANPLLLGAP